MHNIAFKYKDGKYLPAPIFDNGSACMSDIVTYPMGTRFEENIKSVYAKPFFTDFKRQIKNADKLVIDVDGFRNNIKLTDDKSIRAFDTITYGLQEMEGLSWVRS